MRTELEALRAHDANARRKSFSNQVHVCSARYTMPAALAEHSYRSIGAIAGSPGAMLYDAGDTTDGRPWFDMEYAPRWGC